MRKLLLKNLACVMTSWDEPDSRDVDLLIEDGRIAALGKGLEAPGAKILDCKGSVAVPGFVNTHHHFYQTLTRNLPQVQDAKLFDWLTCLYEVWKRLDEDAVYYSSLLAMAELLKTGCTCTTDHHYLYPRGFEGDAMALQFEAADRLGMRFSPSRGSMSLSRKDGGLPPDSVVQTTDEILRDSQRCIEAFHDPSPDSMHKIVLAPCSPFSVTKDCMRESARLARQYGVRLHTHLCETKDEEDTCLAMYGIRPVELMEECGLIGPDVFYAHGIWFNDDELRLLASTGSMVSHCPSSNMRLGSGIARVREMLDLGMRVGIGVDGSASNDSSDMLGELRSALLLQRVRYGSEGIGAREVFKMATVNGAEMLGFPMLGKLRPGWKADVAVFDVSGLEYSGSRTDPAASLIFCGISHKAKHTIVNGRLAVEDGRLIGIDEEELCYRADKASQRLIES